jgi:uncharacterized protein (DUF433 family)
MDLATTLVVPLQETENGVIRVNGTRVRLDTVVYAFNEGYTAEEIVAQYPALDLSDVYAVIAYYLGNRATIDQYVAERATQATAVRHEIEASPEYQAFRESLLKRRSTTRPH